LDIAKFYQSGGPARRQLCAATPKASRGSALSAVKKSPKGLGWLAELAECENSLQKRWFIHKR
jgi:hypothetical protein